MSPFLTLLSRDIRLAVRAGGGAALALAFFATVVTLVPLGVIVLVLVGLSMFILYKIHRGKHAGR